MSFKAAQAAIQGLLAAESGESEAAAEGSEKPTASEAASAEEQAKDNAADESKDSESEQPAKKPRRVKAKLGEKEVEFDVITDDVDPDEFKNGLLMQSDYTKKTSELSESRKALDKERSDLQVKLKEMEADILAEAMHLDSAESLELLESDPEKYYKERAKLERKAIKLKSYREKMQKEVDEKRSELINAERAKWKDTDPSWLDESVMKKDLGLISKLLTDTGFSNDEIGGLYDSRLIKILRKAAKFDELSKTGIPSSKKQPGKKLPNENTAGNKPDNEAMARLRKSHSKQDAVAAIKAFL